ncbi:hypothetical protein AB4144_19885, partial [Rhizobiaceae sp. 2RAB30]
MNEHVPIADEQRLKPNATRFPEIVAKTRPSRYMGHDLPNLVASIHRSRLGRERTRGYYSMANTLLMPKATAVWLVDNTAHS